MRQFDSGRRLMPFFCDSHCHLSMMAAADLETLFASAQGRFSFLVDIGTESGDIAERQRILQPFAQKVPVAFSAGVFPSSEAISNAKAEMQNLENSIVGKKICAIGECGIDRHHNEESLAERELFAMQLDFAAEKKLPVIVHSREAFAETLDIIRAEGCKRGIVHCFSYGKDEARAFLDDGFFISFSGSATYGGKETRAQNEDLARFVPADRILLETDSPYLAPASRRGSPNTPLYIEETFDFIANARGISLEDLKAQVELNARTAFSL